MILYVSEGQNVRAMLLNQLMKKSKIKDMKIADCGGGLNKSYFMDILTDIIDLNNPKINIEGKKVTFHSGDINDEMIWKTIPDKHFDFIICTHTLEDIRNPGYVISQLERVAKSGFISVPNKFTEASPIQSKFYNGYAHHRWIFNYQHNQLMAMFKFANFSLRRNLVDICIDIFYRILAPLPTKKFKGAKFRKPYIKIEKFKKELIAQATSDFELSILWADKIPFAYYNLDFAGRNSEELKELQKKFINIEIDSPSNNFEMTLQELLSTL